MNPFDEDDDNEGKCDVESDDVKESSCVEDKNSSVVQSETSSDNEVSRGEVRETERHDFQSNPLDTVRVSSTSLATIVTNPFEEGFEDENFGDSVSKINSIKNIFSNHNDGTMPSSQQQLAEEESHFHDVKLCASQASLSNSTPRLDLQKKNDTRENSGEYSMQLMTCLPKTDTQHESNISVRKIPLPDATSHRIGIFKGSTKAFDSCDRPHTRPASFKVRTTDNAQIGLDSMWSFEENKSRTIKSKSLNTYKLQASFREEDSISIKHKKTTAPSHKDRSVGLRSKNVEGFNRPRSVSGGGGHMFKRSNQTTGECNNPNFSQHDLPENRVKQMMVMNATGDDTIYDIENELSDVAAYRPLSEVIPQNAVNYDSFHRMGFDKYYSSDSTDSDHDSDENGDDFTVESDFTAEFRNDGRLSSRNLETGTSIDGSSSFLKEPSTDDEKHHGKSRARSTKKKNAGGRRRKRTRKRKGKNQAVPQPEGGQGGFTDREKRVARYRATLERIDRKLQKEGFGETVRCVDENDENATIRFLLSGRVYGYPKTDGSVISNYFSFVKQRHPFLSLFLHHRFHPLKTPKRLVIFFCVLFFAFIMSVILLEGFYFNEKFMCASGCGDEPKLNSTNFGANLPDGIFGKQYFNEYIENEASMEDAEVNDGHDLNMPHMSGYEAGSSVMITSENDNVRRCYGGENDGLEHLQKKLPVLSSLGHQLYDRICKGFMVTGALITPYDLLLKFFATCGCVQGRSFFQDNTIGIHCKGFVISSGDKLLFGFVVLNLLCTLAALYRAYFVLDLPTVLQTFILSEILSFGYWVGWTIPYFSFKFPSDRKAFYKNLRKERKKEWHRNHPDEKMESRHDIMANEDNV